MKSKNKNAFLEHLHPLDTETQTYGYWYTNPSIWGKRYLVPPTSRAKQYRKLKDIQFSSSESKDEEQAEGEEK